MTFTRMSIRASDGTELAMGARPCAGEGPVLLVLHGLFSHMGWYAGMAEELAAGGAAVYLLDRRGAGTSQGARGHMGSWQALVQDVVHAAHEIRSLHPGRAIHALGISLGGTIALATSILHPDVFASHILLAPGIAATIRLPLHRRIRLLHRSIVQPTRLYDLPFTVDEITHDPAWRKALDADPLRTRQVTARFLVETFRMQGFVRAQMPRLRVPTLALLAGEDRLVDNRAAVAALRRAGTHRLRIEVFEGASHILPASVPSDELLGRFWSWLRRPAPAALEEASIVSVPPFALTDSAAFDPPRLLAAPTAEVTS